MDKLDQVEKLLQAFIKQVSILGGEGKVIDRTACLMQLFDNPQHKLKIVHIAGTSGKTSTAYYLSALLKQAGQKVGLTVSPHVDSITERVQINGRALSDKLFADLLTEFIFKVNQAGLKCTYFELMYCFSFWVFAKQKVDYAVVETGVGGLYDATNIATAKDKVCVITDIGFDHVALLGNTLSTIARQKAGIIHPFNSVITYRKSKAVFNEILDQASKNKSQLVVASEPKNEPVFINNLPYYQKRNWWLAKQTYDFIAARDHLDKLSPNQLKLSQSTHIPGRMDIAHLGQKTIVMDGAHNSQKLSAFVKSFQALYPNQKGLVILGLKEGKDSLGIAKILKPVASKVVVTRFYSSRTLPAKAADPNKLAALLVRSGLTSVEAEPNQKSAIEKAFNSDSDIIIITGSFYLLSQLREKYIPKSSREQKL